MSTLRIVEVGPRDGLQNEPIPIPTEAKVEFIKGLVEAGLKEIEATSFVSPKWVPQLGDAAELWPLLPPGGLYSALVPNMRGLERALELGVQRIAVFTAASDAFTKKNINMTVDESINAFVEVVQRFRQAVPGGWVRGYVSTAFECPYSGKVSPADTVRVAKRLADMGVDEVSVGDTIGVAVPAEVKELTNHLLGQISSTKIAYHFHDTRGMGVANVAAAYEMGIAAFDSSAAGLGGCPYAPGAGGNLATEDLVYFFERSGVPTGVSLERLAAASLAILGHLKKGAQAKCQLSALAASHQR